MVLANADIRQAAKNAGVRLWEIAEKERVSDPTMTRRLRTELTKSQKQIYFGLIDQIAAEKAEKERQGEDQ